MKIFTGFAIFSVLIDVILVSTRTCDGPMRTQTFNYLAPIYDQEEMEIDNNYCDLPDTTCCNEKNHEE